MREARGRKGLSQAAAAGELDVTERTYRRWEGGAAVTKERDKAALVRLYGRGLFSWDGERTEPTSPAATPTGQMSPRQEELGYIVGQVREKATRYNIRRAQHAPTDELDRLREELELSVRNGLRAGSGDRRSLDFVVDSLVDLLTKDSEAPATEQAAEQRRKHRL